MALLDLPRPSEADARNKTTGLTLINNDFIEIIRAVEEIIVRYQIKQPYVFLPFPVSHSL